MTYFTKSAPREQSIPAAPDFSSELKAKTGIAGKQLYRAGQIFASLTLCERAIFTEILTHFGTKACMNLLSSKGNLIALGRIVNHYGKRIRKLETWIPTKANTKSWISELIDHLFAAYPTPVCLKQTWFRLDYDFLEDWYFPVANGESLRSINHTPIPVSKKMAHLLREENGHWGSPVTLFRKVQLQAMGASGSVLHQILGSSQSQTVDDEDFWTPIYEFFVRHYDPESRIGISGILDYIEHVFANSEEGKQQFRTRGRTVESLARATDEWHQELHAARYGVNLKWKPQEVKGFEFHATGPKSNDKSILYFIIELCSGPELAREGRAMAHCVASYQSMCAEGRCSIWSLRKRTGKDEFESLVTMQMNPETNELVQIKARFNSQPGTDLMDVVRKWSGREGISIANHAI